MQNKKFNITFAFVLFSTFVSSQNADLMDFDFIQHSKNKFLFTENNSDFKQFYTKFNSCVEHKKDKVSIVHIGDSHIQANIFSEKFRENIEKQFAVKVGRGLIFPYKIAKTSRAIDFDIIKFSNDWNFAKNIDKLENNDLGITGYSISTTKEKSFFTFKFLNDSDTISKNFVIKIWHEKSENYSVTIENKTAYKTESFENNLVISSFEFTDFKKDTLRFEFENINKSSSLREKRSNLKTDEETERLLHDVRNNVVYLNDEFKLYAMEIETPNENIKYHSEGVNGADVLAWLKTENLISQTKILKPDLIIISLGANDGYKADYDTKTFEINYDLLLKKIRTEFPNSAILLTTSGDSFQNKSFININNESIRMSILRLAQKFNCGVWDFYDIMGGLNSITKWKENKLAQDDMLHFTKQGYKLIADLFTFAFVEKL
jgi:lysophospholipase L1-like esterase